MNSDQQKKAFFQSAVSDLMNRMFGTAMRFTRNASDAEDLISEALEKGWKNLDSLADASKFDGWMMRILTNTYISQWRSKQARLAVMDEDISADDLDDRHSLYARLHQPFLLWWGTPEQTFVNNLLVEDIASALDGIADVYREVVILVEIMGFTYEEASTTLNVPVGTVRSRLNRGRRLLQTALWQNAQDAGISAGEPGGTGK